MSDPEERLFSPSLFFEIYALNQAIGRLLTVAMVGSPLTPEEYAIYSAIFEDELITPTRMAHRLGMPLTTVMDQIARLQARGHARRTVSDADRRATLVSLTASGLAAHRGANRYFQRAYETFLAELDLDESDATNILVTIRQAVEEALARAARREQSPSARRRVDVAPPPERT